MGGSHGYETKKKFCNRDLLLSFYKMFSSMLKNVIIRLNVVVPSPLSISSNLCSPSKSLGIICRLLQIILQKYGNSIYPIRFISFQIIVMPCLSKCIKAFFSSHVCKNMVYFCSTYLCIFFPIQQ